MDATPIRQPQFQAQAIGMACEPGCMQQAFVFNNALQIPAPILIHSTPKIA